jgi:hypothetical protein
MTQNYKNKTKEELIQIFDEQQFKLNEIFNITLKSVNGSSEDNTIKTRYWNKDEHFKFLICIAYLNATKCKGLPVIKMSKYIRTRTPVQVRTHAQKYFNTTFYVFSITTLFHKGTIPFIQYRSQ